MIGDKIAHWEQYFRNPIWGDMFAYLRGLTPASPEELTEIRGKDVFGRVMQYETKAYDAANIETHREYIDVQAAIAGEEGIGWWPVGDLEANMDYDAERDRVFYHHPAAPVATVTMRPGNFAVLYPNDGHMPQLMVGEQKGMVKKVVVKVRVGLVWPVE